MLNYIAVTTIKFPSGLHEKLLQRVIIDGYGMRGKSKWIMESVQRFLSLPNYPELVDIATEMQDLSVPVSLRITQELETQLDIATLEIRKQFPVLEAVRSNIVRASVLQRLLTAPIPQ
jgi:hypothetical protein